MYLQIAETLVRDIAAGTLIDGEKLPPERDMAKDLGIAVGTLRKTLSELESRGLLERIQGSGKLYSCSQRSAKRLCHVSPGVDRGWRPAYCGDTERQSREEG